MVNPVPKPTHKKSTFKSDATKRRKKYLEEHQQCEWYQGLVDKHGNLVGRLRCVNPASEVAHLKHRQMGGSNNPEIEQEDNYVSSCRQHHMIFDRLVRNWEIMK